MAPFNFKSESHFVTSSDGTTLEVYKLNQPPASHPSSIHKTHFTQVTNIHADDGLSFPNGAGKINGWEALTRLAHQLAHLRLWVNPAGYCLQDVTKLRMYTDFQIYYLRLNDLFTWSHYGITTRTTYSTPAGWSRSELNHQPPEGGETQELKRYVMIRTDMYDDKVEELRKTEKANEEQKKRLKEMKIKFEIQRQEKDDEVNKLREALDGDNNSYKALVARSGKQHSYLKMLDEEIQTLRNEKPLWAKPLY